ncbi:AAA family ATPase [Planotetraspora thailandica]|uniref:ATP-binding protein n=2 Tax=Planotetraspora thailandica TaxID=487172 RepID=UPI0035E4EE9B
MRGSTVSVVLGGVHLILCSGLGHELGHLLGPDGDVLSGSVGPDSSARFRLFEAVVAAVGEAAAQRPLVLVIDDLQWADIASLHLFSHLAARLPGGTVIIGGLRNRAPVPGSALARTLAAASRVAGHYRIRIGPLGLPDVAEFVRRETGQDPSPGTVHSIYTRTAGNAFFVRELARLLADSGVLTEDAVARAGVPSTVRDVVRDRMTGLDDCARDLLQIAALIGRDVDLSLLADVADRDVQTCLDRLEPVEALGLLEPTPGDPFSMRFSHDLVRESVTETTPPGRASRLHLRVADALERTDSSCDFVAERIAHHLWAAGPLADPRRTAMALVRAGRLAAAESALEADQPAADPLAASSSRAPQRGGGERVSPPARCGAAVSQVDWSGPMAMTGRSPEQFPVPGGRRARPQHAVIGAGVLQLGRHESVVGERPYGAVDGPALETEPLPCVDEGRVCPEHAVFFARGCHLGAHITLGTHRIDGVGGSVIADSEPLPWAIGGRPGAEHTQSGFLVGEFGADHEVVALGPHDALCT